jgi:hypothetical protein
MTAWILQLKAYARRKRRKRNKKVNSPMKIVTNFPLAAVFCSETKISTTPHPSQKTSKLMRLLMKALRTPRTM